MAVFRCKMCGGSLDINENQSIAVCEYCGTKQTLPKFTDEKRLNLFGRANHFRMNNEYDKAMEMYEKILDEDREDAEAYWSLVLCRYGIEYVEDPATKKRVPTVNRAQFTSIFDDEDYKSAIKYADGQQKEIYKAEAEAINEIQKGILSISQKEEPFDVFICYKETDESGRRTHDSVDATELYHALTKEGFKVFFSRITLENILGTAYEPYIFAALNSAKVMVVIGSKPEYFNAVWVKNEWSRFLGLIKNGAEKILIPAYKDMDPYDLPEEFSHLQAQDMNKLGFIQDIIHGIKKLAAPKEEKQEVRVIKETVNTASSTVNSLLDRVFIFLSDGKWQEADEYCEKVLDIEARNGEAYLGKLMAKLHVTNKGLLKYCDKTFEREENYKKIMQFGSDELKKEIRSYIEYIKERIELARIDGIYHEALSLISKENYTFEDCDKAKELFLSIDYEDSAEMAEKCELKKKDIPYNEALSLISKLNCTLEDCDKAKELFLSTDYNDSAEMAEKCELKKKDIYYYSASDKIAIGSEEALKMAITYLKHIPGWKDADEKLKTTKRKLEELIEKNNKEEEDRKKKIKLKAIRYVISAVLIVTAFFVVPNVIIPTVKYNKALSLMEAGSYNEAIEAFEAFEAMNGYKDSRDKIKECNVAFRKKAEIGDTVIFGTYEQDNNSENGKEDIEWLVLDKKDGKVLLISKYGLDCKKYNEEQTSVTWESCTLRKWLNNDFINYAFTDAEKAMIPTVTVEAHKNPDSDVIPGNNTKDKVFLLSIDEVNKYFSSDEQRICKATAYAAQGAYVSDSDSYWWWLRSPGNYTDRAALVNHTGDSSKRWNDVDNTDGAVRPALWVEF